VARAAPEKDSIVSSLRFALSPIGALSTAELVKFTVPKSASGSTVPLLGASAMISADPSCASGSACWVVRVQP